MTPASPVFYADPATGRVSDTPHRTWIAYTSGNNAQLLVV